MTVIPFGIGAKTQAYRQGVVVHPQQVPALGSGLAMEHAVHRHPQRVKPARHSLFLSLAQIFSQPQDDRSPVGHDGRVKDKDGVGPVWLNLVVIDHLGSGLLQETHHRVVLLLSDPQIWAAGIVPSVRVGHGKGLVRSFDQDPAQRRGHALATIISVHHPPL
jgi:hypothetical protein